MIGMVGVVLITIGFTGLAILGWLLAEVMDKETEE